MTLRLKAEEGSPQREEAIRKAAQLIRHGSVVAFPTETFYGLAALATDYNAVAKVYLLKRRAIYKSLSILVADLSELENWIENLSREARHLVTRFWPVNSEAAICGDTLDTTTAGGMPMKISSGVIRKPPPIPNMPERNPTASPKPRIRKMLTGMSAMGR